MGRRRDREGSNERPSASAPPLLAAGGARPRAFALPPRAQAMNGTTESLLEGPGNGGEGPWVVEALKRGGPAGGAPGAQGGDPVPPTDMDQTNADQRLDQLRRVARREAEFRELAAWRIERVRSALLLEQDIERRTHVLQQSLHHTREKLRVAAAGTSGSEVQAKAHPEHDTRRAASRLTASLREAELGSPARRRRREPAAGVEHEARSSPRVDPMAALAAARRRIQGRSASGARGAPEAAAARPQRRGSALSVSSSPSTSSRSTRLRAGSFSGLLTATSPRPTTPRLAAPSPLVAPAHGPSVHPLYSAAQRADTPVGGLTEVSRGVPRQERRGRSRRPSREPRAAENGQAAQPQHRLRRARSAPPRRLARAAAKASREENVAQQRPARGSTPTSVALPAASSGMNGAAGGKDASAEAALREEVVETVTRLVHALERETSALRERAQRFRAAAEREASAQGRLSSVDAELQRALERVAASGLGPKEVATRQREALDEVVSLWDALGVPAKERATRLWEWLASADLCAPAQRAILDAAARLEKRPEIARAEASLATARRRAEERRREAAAAPGFGALAQQVRRAEEDVRRAEHEVVLRQAAAAAAERGLPRPEPVPPRSGARK